MISVRPVFVLKYPSDALREKTQEFKKRLDEGATLDDLLPEAYAAVREAAFMITFLVSLAVLIAGFALYGKLTEKVFCVDNRKTPK